MRFQTALIVLSIIVFSVGCAKHDKVQSLRDCDFGSYKDSAKDRTGYVFACMEAKGYTASYKSECTGRYSNSSECWNYSARVFLH